MTKVKSAPWNMRKEEIIILTEKLIKIESVKTRPENLDRVIGFCQDYFSGRNFVIKRFEKNKKPSLVVTFENTKSPEVFMAGHLDVVEAEKEQFRPEVKRGRLCGRGSADMKGADAVMMLLMKNLSKLKGKPSLGLILTTDEEIGGFDGARYLLEDKGYSCKVAFVPDGGRNFKIITSEKGIMHLKISAKGKSAHASSPWKGENALDKLINAYENLRKEFPNPKGPKDWRISLNLGKMQGGDATNKVADWGEAFIDMRYPETYTKEQILKKINGLIGDLKLEVITSGFPFHTDRDNPYIQRYHEIAEKTLKRKVSFDRSPAASDARFFSPKRIPVILTEPMGGGVHGKNEWVDIKGLEKLYQILEEFVLNKQ